MSATRSIIKNTVALFSSRVISQMISFFAFIYLARVLGPADFGKINFAMAIVTYLVLISDLGLPLFGTKEVARDKDRALEYVSRLLSLRIILAASGFVMLFLITAVMDIDVCLKKLILLYGIGLLPGALMLDWAFLGVEKTEYAGLSRMIAMVLYYSAITIFVNGPAQILIIPYCQVGSNVFLAAILLILFVRMMPKGQYLHFNIRHWKDILRHAFPMTVIILANQILFVFDTTMLGFMKGDAAVGYYSAAFKIMLFFIMASAAFLDALFPVISRYFKEASEHLELIFSSALRIMLIIGIPIAVAGTVLARSIMDTFYGAGYGPSTLAFRVMIWAVLVGLLNAVYGRALLGCDRQKRYAVILSLVCLGNILMNLVLIPKYSIVGAAIATLLTQVIAIPIYYRDLCKVVKVTVGRWVDKPLGASLFMALFLGGMMRLKADLVFSVIGGIFVYGTAFYLMKGIKKEELTLLGKMIKDG